MTNKSTELQTICPTVSEWFYSDNCNYKGRRISRMSFQTIKSVFSNRIEPFIGNKRLNEVTLENCNNIIIRLKEQNACHGTLFGTYSVLTRIFRSALSNKLISEENYPCFGLRALTF